MEAHAADAFALLGLPARFDLDKADIEARQRELSKVLHPDRHSSASAAQRRAVLNRAMAVNEAVRCLKNPVTRGEVLLQTLLSKTAPGAKAQAELPAVRVSPAVLMQVMEWREELAAALTARDRERVARVAARVAESHQRTVAEITAGFEAIAQRAKTAPGDEPEAGPAPSGSPSSVGPEDPDVKHVQTALATLNYLVRLSDEVRRIDEELGA